MRRYNRTRVVVFNAPSAAMWGRPITSRRHFQVALYALIALTVIGFGLAFYVTTSHSSQSREQPPSWLDLRWESEHGHSMRVPSDDGMDITWFSDVGTQTRLESALGTRRVKVMFEGDVRVKLTGVPDPREELFMTSLGDDVEGLRLEEWLDVVTGSRKGGIKLNFKDADGFEQAMKLLESKAEALRQLPVWISVPVANGPGGAGGGVLDARWYTRIINRTFPEAQLVFGWTLQCCDPPTSGDNDFGRGNMESMLSVCRSVNQAVVISAPAVKAAAAWQHFRWLLERSDKLRLLLWSPQNDRGWTNRTVYDLLVVRNDCSKKRIFYDLPEERLEVFRRVAATAGSPLHYFDIHDMDAAQVEWDHSVNSLSHLSRALRGHALMLEADVALQGQGTPNQTDVPVMTHRSPVTISNLTLSQWLDAVLTSSKGIKLDLKSSDVIVPALHVLREKRELLSRPVWVNGDVLRGPNGLHDPMKTDLFLQAINAIFPEVTISLGWTSGWTYGHDNEAYSWEMVERMEKNARKIHQPVTFAVRAVLARRSWEKFDWLLRQSRRYTITLWAPVTSHDRVLKSDMEYVRQQSERGRVYFDIPSDVMPSLH